MGRGRCMRTTEGVALDPSPRELRIPLDGRDTSVELSSIPLDRLLLDEDNPRISFFKDNQVVATLTEQQIDRFHIF